MMSDHSAAGSGTVVEKAAGTKEDILTVEDLHVEFHTPFGVVHAVNGVSLRVAPGETLGILGESGSGKSVTAAAVMGLVRSPPGKVTQGSIVYRGRDLLRLAAAERRRVRGTGIAMVFQDAITSLNPRLTVGHQIGEMFRVHRSASRAEARAGAVSLMERVGIPSAASRVDDYPHQFSGGMCQRVMIATALALGPSVLIADEPTTALDVTVQAQIMRLLKDLQQETGMALVLITHAIGVVAEAADRVTVMYAGRVAETGPTRDVLKRPAHPYTAGLMQSVPSLNVGGARLKAIRGSPPILSKIPPGCAFHPRCDWAEERCRLETPPLEPAGTGRSAACHFSEAIRRG